MIARYRRISRRWHIELVLLLTALLLLGTISTACLVGDGSSEDDGLSEAVAREIEQYEQLVAEYPKNADLRVALAAWYVEGEMYNEAIDQCEEALALEENHQEALLALGKIYIMQEEYGKALEPFVRIIELNEDNQYSAFSRPVVDAYYYAGVCHLELDQVDEAIEKLEVLMEIGGSGAPDAEFPYRLGVAYQRQGNYEEAIDNYILSTRFDIHYTAAYEGLSECYTALGQSSNATYAQGMASYAAGDYNDAIAKLQESISGDSEFALAYQGLGLAYEETGQTSEAIQAYQKAVELDAVLCLLSERRLEDLGAS
jgi:superkiller protein 3